jgi:hypothetical protein
MASTLAVLVVLLIVHLVAMFAFLAACFWLARRNGQDLKSVSLSPCRTLSAEFYPSKGDRQSRHN